jgi:hypothetical protein
MSKRKHHEIDAGFSAKENKDINQPSSPTKEQSGEPDMITDSKRK